MLRLHGPYFSHLVLRQALPGLDLPAWITAISTAVLALGVLLAARQLREARMARLTEAAAGISRRWDAADLIEARGEIDKYPDDAALRNAVFGIAPEGDPEPNVNLLLREPNFFDDLGTQELLGGVTLEWIELTMSDIVQSRWDLWRLTVDEYRARDSSDPPIYGNFQRLAERLRGEHLSRWQTIKRRFLLSVVRMLDY